MSSDNHHIKRTLAGNHVVAALYGLFFLALLYAVYVGRSLLVPIVVAIVLNFLLAPVVRILARLKIPLTIGALLTLMLVLGPVGYGLIRLSDPAAQLIGDAPVVIRQIERKVRRIQRSFSSVQKTAEQLEKIADLKTDGAIRTVQIKDSSWLNDVLSGTGSFVSSVAVSIVILFFLLASGDVYLYRVAHLLLPDERHQSESLVRHIESTVSYYLLTVTLINIGLGLMIGTVLFVLGFPNAALWGVLAGLLNYIPYIGAAIGILTVGAVSFITYDQVGQILAAPALYLLITTIEGNVLTPIILGRRFALNPIVVFLSLICWGALWGISGALLAVPFLVIFKIICTQVPGLSRWSELLDEIKRPAG